MKAVAKKLAKELGPSHSILSSYVIKQTPQRKIPLLQLIELYVSLKGEQAFVENYLDEEELYQGFLTRSAKINGSVTISFSNNVIAQGQI